MDENDLIIQLATFCIEAYDEVVEELTPGEVAPLLEEVHSTVLSNMVDNMVDAYQEVYGEGATISSDGFELMGINPNGIPNITFLKGVLDGFRLPYIWQGRLYNIAQPSFFRPQKLDADA